MVLVDIDFCLQPYPVEHRSYLQTIPVEYRPRFKDANATFVPLGTAYACDEDNNVYKLIWKADRVPSAAHTDDYFETELVARDAILRPSYAASSSGQSTERDPSDSSSSPTRIKPYIWEDAIDYLEYYRSGLRRPFEQQQVQRMIDLAKRLDSKRPIFLVAKYDFVDETSSLRKLYETTNVEDESVDQLSPNRHDNLSESSVLETRETHHKYRHTSSSRVATCIPNSLPPPQNASSPAENDSIPVQYLEILESIVQLSIHLLKVPSVSPNSSDNRIKEIDDEIRDRLCKLWERQIAKCRKRKLQIRRANQLEMQRAKSIRTSTSRTIKVRSATRKHVKAENGSVKSTIIVDNEGKSETAGFRRPKKRDP
ncbi:hypothetical protein BS50DRAFT_589219 [Corynespora cassiicola Philippines]|uniref:Uncharacterized protein n=1 Tax=Corynespora cassiicola Philippines TaxID=1448308 RepID=A0A2T2NM99_CORCC|nr:hypothetical protein BS50DRAFT_589219 [Corynespora cassiicola Philippines]